jgi:uncharacterized protein
MKVILDTNILISALVFDRVCEEVITKWLQNSEIEVFCSPQIWVEIENKFLGGRVLELTNKSKRNIDVAEINDFLKMFKDNVNFVNSFVTVDVCRDSNDNMILEIAKEIRADFIVSGDKDLLVLERFENTLIIDPKVFLEKNVRSYEFPS